MTVGATVSITRASNGASVVAPTSVGTVREVRATLPADDSYKLKLDPSSWNTGVAKVAYVRPDLVDYTGLLNIYRPELRYDSQGNYFADSAATITDNDGNGLRDPNTPAGTFIATPPTLSLDFLDYPNYLNGQTSSSSHYLQEFGTSLDALIDARDMHDQPQYANKIYARPKHDPTGRLWLQYWFFYYYNEQDVAGIGEHQGDWEMIQLGLDWAPATPGVATYARHGDSEAESCAWSAPQMEHPNGYPVVYVARASQGSYFTPGEHDRTFPRPTDWALGDHPDGPIRPDIEEYIGEEVVGDPDRGWVRWRGSWGRDGPMGPSQQPGQKWSDPGAFNNRAQENAESEC